MTGKMCLSYDSTMFSEGLFTMCGKLQKTLENLGPAFEKLSIQVRLA